MSGMRSTRIAAWILALVSLICVVAGFGLGGHWVILVVFPILPLYWFVTNRMSTSISLSILLLAYVLLTVIGLLVHLPPVLMLIGCSSALASWELAQFLLNFPDPASRFRNQRVELLHNRDLFIAIGVGLLVGILGLNIRIQLPFGLIAGLVLLAAYGLYRGFLHSS